jgi:CPA2 family monovalent cation:H+ antiporter-2
VLGLFDKEEVIVMVHLPTLVTDLGIILIVGALVTLLFKKLKQPLVLGYLIAGFFVSPHFPWLPTVRDPASISIWAEIGVIFLLFGLGLEFSFKKLISVGGSATLTAVFEVLFMLGIGYLIGRGLNWSVTDSIFLGGILSISSTTIIVRAFQELGMKGERFVDLVFGILVVEDIVAVLLLVLLPSLAVEGAFSMGSLFMASIRMVFFVLLWFAVGIFVLPAFFRKIRPLLEEETTLIISVGLCLMMVMVASAVGFSAALGAFVMGSLLAETPEGHKIEHLLNPVKNLFAAVFFVSVGMLIDPKVIQENTGLIFLLTIITISGKFISTYLGALISGQSRKSSLRAGMSLAQIGEFSFIIAALGMSMKLTSDFLYPLAVAVSAVTTFTTPYMIKISEKTYDWSEKFIPERIKSSLDRYHASSQRQGGKGTAALMFKFYGMKILLNSVIILAIIYAVKNFVQGELASHYAESPYTGALTFLICVLASIPFFWGLVRGGPGRQDKKIQDLHRVQGFLWALGIGRLVLALALLSLMVSQFVSLPIASGVIGGILLVTLAVSVIYGKRLYNFFEKEFQANLTEKEKEQLSRLKFDPKLLPWNALIRVLELGVDSNLIGQSLRQLSFKEKFGVTIASVLRGERSYFAPHGDFVLWPYDRLVCFGSEEELAELIRRLDKEKRPQAEVLGNNYRLEALLISESDSFKDTSIRDSGLRDTQKALVVGIERGAEKILGPASDFVMEVGDLVWVVKE